MIGKNTFHGLVAALALGLALVAHSPLATATPSIVKTAHTSCPIRGALSAFAVPSKFLSRALSPSSPASETLTAGLSPTWVTAPKTQPLVRLAATTLDPAATAKKQAAADAAEEAAAAKAKEARKASASTALDVHVMGLSIHHAEVAVREKLAIPQDQWVAAAAELVAFSGGAIEEAAVLSTCNRFELYLGASDARGAMRMASKWLESRSGLGQATLRRNLFMLSGEDAGWHLLRVSAGLDSLVVGEGQILAQVAACYQAASQQADEAEGTEAGSGGKVLSRLLNTAVAAGKRVRAETAISKGAVSISSAAVEFSQQALPQDANGLLLSEARVVIVGAGTMTRLLVTHLKSHGVTKIVLVNRSVGPGSRAAELAAEHDEVEWVLKTPDEMYGAIADCDVAFMSTSATEPIVTVDGLNAHVFNGEAPRAKGPEGQDVPLSVVDISVPRNVETAVDAMAPGAVFSYNVDDLKAVVARNTASRKREMLEAEALLQEELAAYLGWHQSLGAVPTIAKLQESAEAMRAAEFSKNEKKLKNLSDKELEAVERLSRGIVNKLLHGPMSHLRSPEDMESKRRTLSTLSALFQLDKTQKGGKKGKKN